VIVRIAVLIAMKKYGNRLSANIIRNILMTTGIEPRILDDTTAQNLYIKD